MKLNINYSIFLLFLSISIQSQVIHVPSDQPTIQSAIDVAVDQDTILVAPGEYFENINFNGKNIVLCSNFAYSNDYDDVASTIINGSTPVHADTGSCVLFISGEDSTTVLQGFTLTGGTGTRWEDEHGPNHWYTEGGGILIQASAPTIKNNIITWNQAVNADPGTTSAGGGGIRCGDGNPHILNNIISYNQGLYGGGIVMNYSGAVIKNNMIVGNSGGDDFGGGGLWAVSVGEHQLIIENNTIVNNSSALGGGGMRLWQCFALVTNNIIYGNTASFSPQIQGYSGNVTYCCVEGGWNGDGNIDADPEFITDSFVLSDESPCVDAGNPDNVFYDPEDLWNPGTALYPAKGGLHADMGAYGGPGCTTLTNVITSIPQLTTSSHDVEVKIFPNPAKSKISIELSSEHEKTLEIQICDSNSVLKRLGSTHLEMNGASIVDADISALSPGVYFVIIRSDTETKTSKFVKMN